MNLGSRLKYTLEERGLTVTQFAKEAAVPAQTIYALINRDSNKADMDILIRLLRALNMDFFTFMGTEAPAGCSAASSQTSAAPKQHAEKIVEKVVEKEVIKEVIKEVPAKAPAGKALLAVDADIYEKVLELAKEEGIEDEAILAQVCDEYLELGFGYRQRPLRSIMRDYAPKAARSGDIDSFLL